MISVFQNSENSGYEYQAAPDMAMTVRMIMILLYGAGGVPGRGEIPMNTVQHTVTYVLPLQGASRTNFAQKHQTEDKHFFGLYIAPFQSVLILNERSKDNAQL